MKAFRSKLEEHSGQPIKRRPALACLAVATFIALLANGCAAPSWWSADPDADPEGVRLAPGMTREEIYDLLGRPVQVVVSHEAYLVEDITWRCPEGNVADLVFVEGRLAEHRTLPSCFVRD
jgi:hypothetical protein